MQRGTGTEILRNHRGPILLVEDNPRDADLFNRAFSQVEYPPEIFTVRTAPEAVEFLQATGAYANRNRFPPPELMFLDLKLPAISDGLGLVAWVREQPLVRRLPIIILTSDRSPESINHAYDLGVNSYLIKPYDHDGLVGLLGAASRFWNSAQIPKFFEV